MEIEVLRPQELSAARVARWAELQASDIVLDSPFLSPGWSRAVERAQGKGAHDFRVAVVRDSGRDVAFLAGELADASGELVAVATATAQIRAMRL